MFISLILKDDTSKVNLLIRQMLMSNRWRQQHLQSAGNNQIQLSPEQNRDN